MNLKDIVFIALFLPGVCMAEQFAHPSAATPDQQFAVEAGGQMGRLIIAARQCKIQSEVVNKAIDGDLGRIDWSTHVIYQEALEDGLLAYVSMPCPVAYNKLVERF